MKIAKEILSRYGKVRMWSWEKEPLALPLDEIYVDLYVEKLDHLKSSGVELLNLDQLFRKGKNTRIYLYGEAGAGKTTLTQHLIYVWSQHVLMAQHNDTGKSSGVGNFQYVVPLFLRNTKEENLYEAIGKQLGLDSQETDLLLKKPPDILFVCEGYDEFNDSTCQDISQLVRADLFPDSSLLVTSREHIYLPEKVLPDYILQLKGFTHDEVQKYINTVYPIIENPDTPALLREIGESDFLKGLSTNPALLLLMCNMWREGKLLVGNVTEFFKDFIAYACMRSERKVRDTRDQNTKEQVLNIFKPELLKIGKIAVDGFRKDEIQLVFTLNKVKEMIGENAWKLGLFKHNEKARLTVSFHHRLLQEYFAAFFIVHCSSETRCKILMDFYKSSTPLKRSAMFTKFIKGFGWNDIALQISSVIGTSGVQSPRILTDLQLQHTIIYPDAKFPLPSHVEFSIGKFGADTITRYLSLDGNGLFNIRIEINHIADLSILQHINAPDLEVLNAKITGSGEGDLKESPRSLGNILPRFRKLHTLRCRTAIRYDNRSQEQLYHLLTNLHKLNELKILDLTGTCLGEATIITLSSALEKMFGLLQLILENCSINNDTHMKYIVGALGNLQALTLINLANNKAGFVSFTELVNLIEHTDTLQKLILWDQDETRIGDLSALFRGLSKHRQLECLDMRRQVCHFNEIGGMPRLFASCVNLKMFHVFGLEFSIGSASKKTSLILKDVEVGEKEMESISKLIVLFRELTCLAIYNCKCSPSSGWFVLFKNMDQLKKLHSVSLVRVNADEYALKHIHSSLRALRISSIVIVGCQKRSEQKFQPILVGLREYDLLGMLNLSNNSLSDNEITWLATALPELNALATLKLVKCCITDKPSTHLLIQSFGRCRSLKSLNLEGNDLRDRLITQIGKEITGMVKIKSISLRDCGLIGLESAEYMLEVLTQYQNIQSLDLSRNFVGDDRSTLFQLENKAREKGVSARIHIYKQAQI